MQHFSNICGLVGIIKFSACGFYCVKHGLGGSELNKLGFTLHF